MKVNFLNKKIRAEMSFFISIIASIATILLGTGLFCACTTRILGAFFILAIIIFYIITLLRANKIVSKKITIRKTSLTIKFGDITKESGRKIVPFNEFFDTKVDDIIIARESANGKLVEEFGQEYIDNIINNDNHIKQHIEKKNCARMNGGKNTRYRLGTTCLCKKEDKEFFLVAFSKFDKDDKAFHTTETYVSCLMHLWNELDCLYASKPIVMPLLGSGLTRFKDNDLSNQELLKIIVWTFKQSRVNFTFPSSLTIVLPEKMKNEISLYEVD